MIKKANIIEGLTVLVRGTEPYLWADWQLPTHMDFCYSELFTWRVGGKRADALRVYGNSAYCDALRGSTYVIAVRAHYGGPISPGPWAIKVVTVPAVPQEGPPIPATDCWNRLIKHYANGRTICNCGHAYCAPIGHGFISDEHGNFIESHDRPVCPGGCSANQLVAREEIARRVLEDLVAVPAERCEHCAKGLPRVRGSDDRGAEWWHIVLETPYAIVHCQASDFLEGRED